MASFGDYAPHPPIHRWREDERKRFLAELDASRPSVSETASRPAEAASRIA